MGKKGAATDNARLVSFVSGPIVETAGQKARIICLPEELTYVGFQDLMGASFMCFSKVVTGFVIVLTIVLGRPLAHADTLDRPNVIVILADDMGWFDIGHDELQIDTPNLDKLIAQGTRLTQFYASASICSPTRAALLTGRYPHSVGMPELANPSVRRGVAPLGLDHDAITIPEALKPYGYTSALIGKWHLGFAPEHWPRTHGFDEFWGSLLGTPGYYDSQETYHNETPIKVHGYFTDRITDQAIEFVEDQQKGNALDQPFFLYLAYNAPHYPLEAPFELVKKYRKQDRFHDEGLFAIYAAMIEQLDTGIGRVMETLDRLSLADDTLVVFCSDNGPSPESHSYGLAGADISNGPLREHKFSHHEGGMRVPFIARWPGHIPAGATRTGPAITMDIMPTILDATEISPPVGAAMNGTSLLPLLRGESFDTERPLFWENRQNGAVLRGQWKLVHQYWNEQPHLYDLENDLSEEHDLAAEHPKITAELLELHRQWRKANYSNPQSRSSRKSSYSFPSK